MASDDDFFVVRRFGKLGARVGLFMQDRIVKLETELQHNDQLCKEEKRNELADNGTFRNNQWTERDKIMNQLSLELPQYRMIFQS